MKKFLFSLMALMAILPASADRYLTFGVNDTLRVPPSSLGSYQVVMLRAHFDYRLDIWNMTLTLPVGLQLMDYNMKNDMSYIPYVNYEGDSTTCSAQLFKTEIMSPNHNNIDSLSASITVFGYWLFNGHYNCYGYVKWEPGDYDEMCELLFKYSDSFPDTASIFIRENISSTIDMRGGTAPNTYLEKTIHLYVGYMRGDVDGNEEINVADVTELIDYILTGIGLDEYQLTAADVDRNGIVDIADVTALADLINLSGNNEFENPSI